MPEIKLDEAGEQKARAIELLMLNGVLVPHFARELVALRRVAKAVAGYFRWGQVFDRQFRAALRDAGYSETDSEDARKETT